MKFKTLRNEEPKEVNRITVYIGEAKFTIKEGVSGNLCINKIDIGEESNGALQIHPRYSNEIEIT